MIRPILPSLSVVNQKIRQASNSEPSLFDLGLPIEMNFEKRPILKSPKNYLMSHSIVLEKPTIFGDESTETAETQQGA